VPKHEPSNGKIARPVGNHHGDVGNAIRAPIPGVILSIAVREGTEVAIGQDLCILEAMKMKNSIRSPRKGVIAKVHALVGQSVQHHEILMEFTE
jgi:propionyl-CoA carboxylase alpha chain